MKRLTYTKRVTCPCYHCNETGIDPIEIHPKFTVVCRCCRGSKVDIGQVSKEIIVENDTEEETYTEDGYLIKVEYLNGQ